MTAIQESFADHSFTPATIITRKLFNLTSLNLIFEVSASFPTSEDVLAQILLIPEDDYLKGLPIKGRIVLLVNRAKTIKAGYSFADQNNIHPFEKSPKPH